MNKVSSGGLIALMVLAANAIAASPNMEPNCTKEKCVVTVMVNGNTCGGGIAMWPDPLMAKLGSGPLTITWQFVGDWEFDKETGIKVIEPGPSFSGSVIVKGNQGWQAGNDAKTKGAWRYEVNLVRKGKDGVEKCSRDPTIVIH
jgi:hypothetical protein